MATLLEHIKTLAEEDLDRQPVCEHHTSDRAVCRACSPREEKRKLLAQVALDFTKLAPLLDDWADEVCQASTMSKNDSELFELWVEIRDRMTVAFRKPRKSGYTGCTCRAGYENNCIVHGGDNG
jgi:hypothetical protein